MTSVIDTVRDFIAPSSGFHNSILGIVQLMNPSPFLTIFSRQLRFWTFHCIINAAPSFCIAVMFLKLGESPVAISAMFAGIGTFILLYATATSVLGPLANEMSALARALRVGARFRSVIAGIALVLSFTRAVSVTPDFWSGYLSVFAMDKVTRVATSVFAGSTMNGTPKFLSIYLTTLLEGFLLSILLLTISFFALIVLQWNERRRIMAVAVASRRNAVG